MTLPDGGSRDDEAAPRSATPMHYRVMSALVGVVAAAFLGFSMGFFAAVGVCDENASGLCTNFAGLVPILEGAILIVIVLAPLGGGIVSAIRCQERWVVRGVLIAIAMSTLMFAVSTGQTATLS